MSTYQFVANSHEKTRHIAKGMDKPSVTLCGLRNVDRYYGWAFEQHSGICLTCVAEFAKIAGNEHAIWAAGFLFGWLTGRQNTMVIQDGQQ